jgi:hypothetical protein
MSLTDLNELSNMIMGCSLLELNEDDLRCLYIDVLKVLADHVHSESLKWWGEINKQGYSSWAYYQKDFDFPWMLNDTLVLADMCDIVDAEVEQRKKERESKGTKASS